MEMIGNSGRNLVAALGAMLLAAATVGASVGPIVPAALAAAPLSSQVRA
jgi:hypothetical protein